jgi:hypothetical protein
MRPCARLRKLPMFICSTSEEPTRCGNDCKHQQCGVKWSDRISWLPDGRLQEGRQLAHHDENCGILGRSCRCCKPAYTGKLNIKDSMHVQYIPHASNRSWFVYASASAVRNAVMSARDEEELPRCGGAREWANAFSPPIVVALKKQVRGVDLSENNCN